MRESFERVSAHARASGAPPARELDRFWYGVAQPLLGLRTLWQTPALRRRALVPVLVVLVLAALGVVLDDDVTPAQALARYYAAIVGLASVPAVLFARSYERLAAEALPVFGFAARPPLLSSLPLRLRQAVRAAVLVALGAAPLLILLRMLPLAGGALAYLASGAWTLHWIVVEALDGARVAEPHVGEPSPPWFAAWTFWDGFPAPVRGPVRSFGRLLVRLSKPWVEEVALVARHPALAAGFGLATAALLAVPIANLLLRPAIIVGAVHLRGQLAARGVR